MAKKPVIVKGTEHIGVIAATNSVRDWRSIWQQDGALQGKRNNPLILFSGLEKRKDDAGVEQPAVPGDTVTVNEPATKIESGQTNAHHPFKLETDKVKLRIRVLDENFKPLRNAKYRLYVDGIRRPFGEDNMLDSDFGPNGMIDVHVPEAAQSGELVISYKPEGRKQKDKDWPIYIQGIDVAAGGGGAGAGAPAGPPPAGPAPVAPPMAPAPPPAPAVRAPAGPMTKADTLKAEAAADEKEHQETVEIHFRLSIGRLDPIKDKSPAPDAKYVPGMQQRLNNLGFEAGIVDGFDDDEFKAAVKRFQKRFKIDPPDGASGPATQQKMEEFYSSETATAPDPTP